HQMALVRLWGMTTRANKPRPIRNAATQPPSSDMKVVPRPGVPAPVTIAKFGQKEAVRQRWPTGHRLSTTPACFGALNFSDSGCHLKEEAGRSTSSVN